MQIAFTQHDVVGATHLDFVFDEWIKDVDQTGIKILRDEPMIPQIAMALDQGNVHDEAYLLFREGAQSWNDAMDAAKMFSFDAAAPNLAFGETMELSNVIDALPLSDLGNTSVPIFVNAQAGGTVSISFPEIRYMPDNLCLSLEDLSTGEVFPVAEGTVLEFTLAEATSEVRFTLHMQPVVNAEVVSPACFGSSEGSIHAETYLGSSAQFQWINENGVLLSVEPGATFSQVNNLSAGTYYLVVSGNDLLCGEVSIPFNLDQPAQETAWYDGQIAECNIEGDGAIAMEVSDASYNYTISGEGFLLQGSGLNGPSYVDNLNAGNYEITISTACNSWTETIDLSDELAVLVSAQPSATELSLLNGEASVSFSNYTSGATHYMWDFGDGTTSETENPVHVYTEPGLYTITLTAHNEVCLDMQSFEVLVNDQVVGTGEANAQDFSLLNMGDHYQILPASGATAPAVVRLFDASGRIVSDLRINAGIGSAIRVDTGTLSSGVYSLMLLDGEANVLYRTRLLK